MEKFYIALALFFLSLRRFKYSLLRQPDRRLPESDPHLDRAYLFCPCPTGDIGKGCLCTRAPFHIVAIFHRRTANGRPYGSDI